MGPSSFEPTQKMDVKGASAIQGNAPFLVRFCAVLTDSFWVILLYWIGVKFLNFSPLLNWDDSLVFNFALILAYALQVKTLGGTFGQHLWGLEKEKSIRRILKAPFFRNQTTKATRWIGSVSLCLSLLMSYGLFKHAFFNHPLFKRANLVQWKHYIPQAKAQKNWMTLPFFYTLGAWPRHFSTRLNPEQNKTVLYSIPYEKGPPKHFAGRILARWELPDIAITIEGPKTPLTLEQTQLYKRCIIDFHTMGFSESVLCTDIRHKTLGRHVSEMNSLKPSEFSIRWLEIPNPHIPPKEWVRGVLISAANQRKAQDRVILITPNGAHQTFILNRPRSDSGQLAFALFKQTLGTLRVSSKLQYGRALVNQKLSHTNIKKIKPGKNPFVFMDKLSEIQALLLAKISVDPKNYEAYYHLGGTSYLMLKQAIKMRQSKQLSLEENTLLAERIDAWTAAVKPMIHSSYLFAKDIAPSHPNTDRLYSIWSEVEKL